MLRYIIQKIHQSIPHPVSERQSEPSLQLVLWCTWTLAVVGVAAHHWYVALMAHIRLNITGVVIDCLFCGLIGLLIITKIEMWVEPWRFLE